MPDSSPPDGLRLRARSRLMAILGHELISSEIVALTELVKNSFDADARMVLIRLTGEPDDDGSIGAATGRIDILDDGHGMSETTIRETWLEPATGFRRKHLTTPDGRRVLGEKGVGRFASAKVGDRLDLTSKADGAEEVHLAVDWSAFEDPAKYLDEIELRFDVQPEGVFGRGGAISEIWGVATAAHLGRDRPPTGERGTLLAISALRSAWTPGLVRKLELSLQRLISPFDEVQEIADEFQIVLAVPESLGCESGLVQRPDILRTPHYRLNAEVDDLGNATVVIELQNGDEHFIERRLASARSEDTPRCGPFELRLNVWDRDTTSLRELAEEVGSAKLARELLNSVSGVSIYRDGFRVLPFGEQDDDWLRLDMRRIQEPTQRLSNNQIVGYLLIGRDTNPELTDQTNREGLIEGPALDDLRHVVVELLKMLELERYKIRPRKPRKSKSGLFDRIDLSELRQAIAAEVPDDSPVLTKLDEMQEHVDDRMEMVGEVLSRYHRLATLGQLVDGVVHEIAQPLVAIRTAAVLGSEAIDESSAERPGDDQRQTLLKQLGGYFATITAQARVANEVLRRIAPFGGRRRGRPQNYVIETAIRDAVALMRREVESIGAEIRIPQSAHEVALDGTEFQEVIVNLLSNSLHWLRRVKKESRVISIDVQRNEDNSVSVIFEDSGPGVPEGDQDYIFDPYFTTKANGVGLGLSIAGEIVKDYYGGDLELLSSGELGGARFRATFRKRVG